MPAQSIRLHVEVEGDGIAVTFQVIYRKPSDAPGLVAFALRADKSAGIPRADFLARAWRVANDEAREFGWIV
jgi:hypothetical protein